MKKILCVLCFLPAMAFAEPGAYLQGQFGGVYLIDGSSINFSGPTGYAGRGSVGYLWGGNDFNYGLEGGVGYFPHATLKDHGTITFYTSSGASTIPVDSTLTYSGTQTDILGVLKYTFNCGFDLFAKAGAAYLNQDATEKFSIGSVSTQASHSGDRWAPEVAIGAGYQMSPAWEINVTESSVLVSQNVSANNAVATTNMLLVGLTYHFA